MITVTIQNTHAILKVSNQLEHKRVKAYIYRKLTQYNFTGKKEYIPELCRTMFPITAVYADMQGTTFRINTNAYIAFKKEMVAVYGQKFETTVSSMYTPKSIDQDMVDGIVPRDVQIPAVKLVHRDDDYNARMFSLAPGQGKCTVHNTPVLTPKGWVRIGDLRVGEHVIDSQGRPTEVLGVYPQGKKDLYLVRFIDGTTVECCGEHLWTVSNTNLRHLTVNGIRRTSTITVNQMLSSGVVLDARFRFAIPLADAIQSDDVDVPIDPYLLGVLLNGRVTFNALVKLGLNGKHCYQKFIPERYLRAGLEQRRALYQGLIDTDGHTDNDRLIEYSTSSKSLANDFCDLARSLGKVVIMSKRIPFYTYKGVRKQGRLTYSISELTQCNGYKSICSITPSHKDYAVCIAVDAPDHLFIIEGYNLTHNTISTLLLLKEMKVTGIGLMRPGYIGVWTNSIKEFTTADTGDYLVIRGKAQLMKWIDDIDHVYRYVLISNKTYDRWVKRTILLLQDGTLVPKVTPWNIMEKANAGVTFVDEVHKDFHFNYMLQLRTTVPKYVGLSGTFISEDQFIIPRQQEMFPITTHRYDPLTIKRYIHVVNYSYSTNPAHTPVVSYRGNSMYNGTAYEKWLSKNSSRLNNYLAMILEIIDHDYVSHRISGSKAIVFFASVDMVTAFNDYLIKHRPELVSIVYVAANVYDELLTPDIINSTLLKAGTAVDIPKLMLVVNTASVRSIQTNIQCIGRLRDIEESLGVPMRYVQLFNRMITQHNVYDRARAKQFIRIAKTTVTASRLSPI